ncbi:hypothetical protein Amn_45600 [Aminobacter sp. Y103A]|nr:hypothetical protein Amn_45600 [Aminobacter sp. SS-2016]
MRPGTALRLVRWLQHKLHHVRRIDGVLVVAFEPVNIDRIESALRLIGDHDPIRYRHLVQDLERIWVSVVPGSVARFRRSDWTCDLDEPFVETATPELIASAIVHEATHARLYRMGFGYEEAIRERVEHICLRRELAFAAKIPGGIDNHDAEAILHSLPDLSNDGFARRRGEDFRAIFLRLGMPGWLAGFFVSTSSWLHRRRRRKSAGTR